MHSVISAQIREIWQEVMKVAWFLLSWWEAWFFNAGAYWTQCTVCMGKCIINVALI